MISPRSAPGALSLGGIFQLIDQAMPLADMARARVRAGGLEHSKLLDQLPAHRRSRRQELQKVHEPLPRRVADQVLDLAAVDFSLRLRYTEHARQERLDDDALRHDRVDHLEALRRQLDETVLVGLDPAALL